MAVQSPAPAQLVNLLAASMDFVAVPAGTTADQALQIRGGDHDLELATLHVEYEFIEFTLQLWRAMNLNSFSDEFNV